MSATQRITLASVARMRPGDTLWDSEIKGFGARCRADAISYVFKKRVKGHQTWITIGRHGSPWTPETARPLRHLNHSHHGHDQGGALKV